MKLRKRFSLLQYVLPLLAWLVLVCGVSPRVFAQTTASLSGNVQDASGAIVPNAHVILTNVASKDKRELETNTSGYFTFAGIIPGTYVVDISAPGFRSLRQADVVVNPGDVRNLPNLALAVGTSNESVTVQSSASEIAPEDSGERSALLTTQDIDRLPIQSRNMSELLKILPGVTTTASGTGNGPGFDFSDTGSSGSAVGVGLNTNGAPYRGGTAYLLDGASIIDPGCACYSIATVNPDMTQEVKVQTSNFGADAPQGPVVINIISRSGTSDYHGQAYFYARNGILNANTWQDKHSTTPTARPEASYYYPGGSIGGPILIPHTGFNRSRKLIFWAGFESFRQNLPASAPLTSYVPTAAMRAGNFSLADPANAALCANSSSTGNDFCQNLSGFAPDGTALAGTQIPTQYMDAGALALLKLFPAANVDPATNASGYNYFLQPNNTHNGYIYRGRVDYNINDRNKVFVSYQYGSDSETTVAHIYYNPGNAVAYPGGPLISPVHSHVLSGSYIHVFSSAATNELRISAGWLDNPYSAANLQAISNATIGYPYGTVYSTASLLAPSINSPGARTLPDISQPDLFQQGGTFNSIKKSPSVSDDFTFVYKTHTFKMGGFWSRGANKQGTYGYTNGSLSYASGVKQDQITGLQIGTANPLANFLMGITSGFSQNNTNPIDDMYYTTAAGYILDNWKIKPRLTLNLGLRLEHLGRWQDASGTGLAVWEPQRYAADVSAGKIYPGVYWHATDSTLPIGGSPVQTIFLEPRLGLAYDVRGNGSTVVRGGWSAYRWNDQYNDYAGPLQTALGVKTFNSNSGQAITLKEIGALGANAASLGALPSSVYATDQNDDEVGVTYAYNMTVSQRIPHAMLLEVAYVGNRTQNILLGGQSNGSGVGGANLVNQNKIPLGGLFRPDPITGAPAPADPETAPVDYYPYSKGYGSNAISVNSHQGYANYNGLQFSLIRQRGHATFNANYTYSKSLGIVSSTLDAFNVANNYGVLNIDRPHVVNTSYAFDLGSPIHGNRFAGGAVNGWTLSGTTTWQAGGNLQANTSQNLGLTINYNTTDSQGKVTTKTIGAATYYGTTANSVLPILTCDPKANLKTYQHVNLDCFSAPQIGQVGIRQAPYLSTPSFFDSDLGIYKTFHIKESQAIELRGTAFNFLNHPLPGFSTSDLVTLKLVTNDKTNFTSQVPNANRGITDAKYTQRTVLLAVKYKF
ncbi:carboxypeptidase regulatory-like domain-containing protein [Terriglobus saanensis]|uniref:TonB-dependent receptor plug n=1 Tax=Terriglobus saanensis (strain ATCC BAA-1853 / DSM 23119 / SP1PR4) TaxID=401053 RepID=E8UYQ1_TERSS|nr:carboxypeptidase regulatory-like domain-containing protein [Terriglobus saanensis]ADV83204.1 TonB-dependent receptor plug [Terriglobus saanensis SP1PR4]